MLDELLPAIVSLRVDPAGIRLTWIADLLRLRFHGC
jgi:hypothetical protein